MNDAENKKISWSSTFGNMVMIIIWVLTGSMLISLLIVAIVLAYIFLL